MPLVAAPGYHVIADHDWYTCNNRGCKYRWDDPDLPTETRCPKCDTKKVSMPAGQMYAMRCSENFWMPREPGTDANDYHRATWPVGAGASPPNIHRGQPSKVVAMNFKWHLSTAQLAVATGLFIMVAVLGVVYVAASIFSLS